MIKKRVVLIVLTLLLCVMMFPIISSADANTDEKEFSKTEIEECLQAYEVITMYSAPRLLNHLGLIANEAELLEYQEDAFFKTNVKFSDFKEKMLDYVSEKYFNDLKTKGDWFKEENGLLWISVDANGYMFDIANLEKVNNKTYTADLTSKNGDFLKVEFGIVEYNGKCVIDFYREIETVSITFKDKNLYNMIVKALGNKISTKVDNKYMITMTKSNLESVTNLELNVGEKESSIEVSNLEGIEKFTNLKKLEIESTKITDIGLLSSLTNLEELYIYGSYKIKDYSRSTSNRYIKDLTPISKLSNLKKLALLGYNIRNISSLSTLTKLTELDLMDNKIKDISPISKLTNLQTLHLDFNEISDIKALSNLSNLKDLSLGGNKIDDLTALMGLKKLEYFVLSPQELSITTNKSQIELPKIFAQVKNKNIYYTSQEIKCVNCGLTSNKTRIKLNSNAKEAKVYIKEGGDSSDSIVTLTIKYNGQSTNKITSLPYTGISTIVIPGILIISIIAIFLYMINKKFKGL